jgi:hypothetical protein
MGFVLLTVIFWVLPYQAGNKSWWFQDVYSIFSSWSYFRKAYAEPCGWPIQQGALPPILAFHTPCTLPRMECCGESSKAVGCSSFPRVQMCWDNYNVQVYTMGLLNCCNLLAIFQDFWFGGFCLRGRQYWLFSLLPCRFITVWDLLNQCLLNWNKNWPSSLQLRRHIGVCFLCWCQSCLCLR